MTDRAQPLLPVEEALARILADAQPLERETVSLMDAHRRTLAADLEAKLTQPPFDASAMDGYALRAADIAETPASLAIVGEAAAGHGLGRAIGPGEAARIFTGAPVPEGADTVVMQEKTRREGGRVTILEAVAKGTAIRPRGMDFTQGAVLLEAGLVLESRHLTLAAAMGHGRLSVVRRPVVAILATGDELVMPGETPRADQIVSSIPYGLAAMLAAAGAEPRLLGIARDTRESLDAHIAAAEGADILLTIGGASVGEHDLVQDALKARGMDLAFWRIAMRPGKPLMYGRLTTGGPGRAPGHGAGQRVIGVPGNPVSAMICARIFAVPLIARLTGRPADASHASGTRRAILAAPLPENGPRQHYMRATSETDGEGRRRVTPTDSQDSALMTRLAQADCLIVRPPHAPALEAGAEVPILPLDF